MRYRTYVRNDKGDGLLMIVFDGSRAVLAIDASGALYKLHYWRDESAFANKRHFTCYESSTIGK